MVFMLGADWQADITHLVLDQLKVSSVEGTERSPIPNCHICNWMLNREVFSTGRGSSIRPTYRWTHSDWTGQRHDNYSGRPALNHDCLLRKV